MIILKFNLIKTWKKLILLTPHCLRKLLKQNYSKGGGRSKVVVKQTDTCPSYLFVIQQFYVFDSHCKRKWQLMKWDVHVKNVYIIRNMLPPRAEWLRPIWFSQCFCLTDSDWCGVFQRSDVTLNVGSAACAFWCFIFKLLHNFKYEFACWIRKGVR